MATLIANETQPQNPTEAPRPSPAQKAEDRGRPAQGARRRLAWLGVLVLMLAAASLAAAVFGYLRGRSSIGEPLTDSPRTQSPQGPWTTVQALGHLEPEGGVIGVGVLGPDRVVKVLVEEGAEVQQGQDLVLLESRAARLAELRLAETQREEGRRRLDALTAARKAKVTEAEIHLREVKEVVPLEIQALQKQVALLTRQRDAEVSNLQRMEARPAEVQSRLEAESKERAVLLAQIELTRAASALEKAQAARELNLQAAEEGLREARAALERAPKEVPLQSLENACRVAEEHLLMAQVPAPVAGRILKVFTRAGEAAGGGRPLLQMADTRRMAVRAEVYETDAARVRPGQTATVTSPALPGPGLKGIVSRVGQTVGRNRVLDPDPTADVDRRVVEVMIRLEPDEAAARWVNLEVRVAIAAEIQEGKDLRTKPPHGGP